MMGPPPSAQGAMWGTAPGTQFAGIPPDMLDKVQHLCVFEDEADRLSIAERHAVRCAPTDNSRGHILRIERGRDRRKAQDRGCEDGGETHAEIGWKADVHQYRDWVAGLVSSASLAPEQAHDQALSRRRSER